MSDEIYGQGRCDKHGPYTLTTEGCPRCGSEDAAAKLKAAVENLEPPIRCEISGNPAGTDTWVVGKPCQCRGCQLWMAQERTRELEAENETIRKDCVVVRDMVANWDRWIPVEERLPDSGGEYLTFGADGEYSLREFWPDDGIFDLDDARATHWQPLPDPPEEE